MEITPFDRNLPLVKALPVPFWEVTLARDIQQFKAPLGLTPNIPSVPSLNIVASIVFGRTSLQAIIRSEFGDSAFRNLKNYALGRVKEPRSSLALATVGRNKEVLDWLAEVLRNPQDASLIKWAAAIEGASYRLFRFTQSIPTQCHHCGARLITRAEEWWANQPCDLGQQEAQLIDRICMVMIVLHFLSGFTKSAKKRPLPNLSQLASANAHPNANWLNVLAEILGAPTLSALGARAGADLKTESIWRYARGEMLTPEAVEKLTANITHSQGLKVTSVSVRAMSFAIEFLRAAHRFEAISARDAQQIIAARIDSLSEDVSLALDALLHRAGELTSLS